MSSSPTVVWRWTSGPLSERAIRHAERALGVEFPVDYRACVRDNHGGAPEPDEFAIDSVKGGRLRLKVGLLLSLDPREDENVVATAQAFSAQDRLPDRLVPIIVTDVGSFLCLDYRGDPPTITYFDSSEPGSTVPVAESFAAFLGMLGTTRADC